MCCHTQGVRADDRACSGGLCHLSPRFRAPCPLSIPFLPAEADYSGFLSCLRSAPGKQLSIYILRVTEKQAQALWKASLGNVQ